SSKKDIEKIILEADKSGRVILMLDEIQRLDKAKQDLLLPHLETGIIMIIGATTSNHYHANNPAIRSRTQIFKLHPWNDDDIKRGITRALEDKDRGLGSIDITLDDDALEHFVKASNGDIRSALNGLELAVLSDTKDSIHVTLEDARDTMQQSQFIHDKD